MTLDLVGVRGTTLLDILWADIQFIDDLNLAIQEGRFTMNHLQERLGRNRQADFELLKKALKELNTKFRSE
jgi:hypothetical protein